MIETRKKIFFKRIGNSFQEIISLHHNGKATKREKETYKRKHFFWTDE